MKRVLLVFYGDHLPYSPTTLGIFKFLREKGYQVRVLANKPNEKFGSKVLEEPEIEYLDLNNLRYGLVERLLLVVIRIMHKLPFLLKCLGEPELMNPVEAVYIRSIRKERPDIIIAVDFFALWCVQQLNWGAHLLSLQIEDNKYSKALQSNLLRSVIIQSKVRYDYLFGSSIVRPPCYILPNSQSYVEVSPNFDRRARTKLVYCGSALTEFGIFSILDFLNDYSEYSLTIKGSVPKNTRTGIELFYRHLLEQGRLILDEAYLDAHDLTVYLTQFRIGFAFYDFFRFESLRNPNYYTAPSGKMYQYFNSGVPVVANDYSGFDLVRDRRAGAIVKSLGTLSIKRAIDVIEGNYQEYAINAKRTSAEFDMTQCMEGLPVLLDAGLV